MDNIEVKIIKKRGRPAKKTTEPISPSEDIKDSVPQQDSVVKQNTHIHQRKMKRSGK